MHGRGPGVGGQGPGSAVGWGRAGSLGRRRAEPSWPSADSSSALCSLAGGPFLLPQRADLTLTLAVSYVTFSSDSDLRPL